jgi:hypothetical protein
VAGDRSVTFNANSLLDVSFLDGSDRSGSWDVLRWGAGASVSGTSNLAWASGVDTNLWSMDTNNNSLTITAVVPTPSTLAMGAAGLACVLLPRRRRV